MALKKQQKSNIKNLITIYLIAKNSMNTSSKTLSSDPNKQRGITLIMILIFIVTLSLIAAVGMRGVMVGDRIVANELDRSLAFQAAESAGREAVAAITAGTHTLNFTAHLPLGGNTQFWQTSSNLAEAASCTASSTERFRWSAASPTCSTASSEKYLPKDPKNTSLEKYTNATLPRYVIELMPAQLASPTTTDCWYRITSRATGGTGQADVILQLMFAKSVTNPIPATTPPTMASCT
jgi:type IV pilus assembly protein PilX